MVSVAVAETAPHADAPRPVRRSGGGEAAASVESFDDVGVLLAEARLTGGTAELVEVPVDAGGDAFAVDGVPALDTGEAELRRGEVWRPVRRREERHLVGGDHLAVDD